MQLVKLESQLSKLSYEYVNIIVCFSCPARFNRPYLRYTPLKKCS